jgi:hypothetical protein
MRAFGLASRKGANLIMVRVLMLFLLRRKTVICHVRAMPAKCDAAIASRQNSRHAARTLF